MKRVVSFLFLLIALPVFINFCSPFSQDTTKKDEQKEQKINDIDLFLNSYFSTWSNKDIEAYQSHFHKDAIVMFITGDQVQRNDHIQDFIQGQATVLSNSNGILVEHMTSYTIDHLENKEAYITAQWELINGSIKKTGVDRFILIKGEDDKWKILVLIWSTNY